MITVCHLDWDLRGDLHIKASDGVLDDAERALYRQIMNATIGGDVVDVMALYEAGHYRTVAEVETDDLERAYMLTNSIDCPWWENATVRPNFDDDGCRSTSVGDIIERDGELFVVASFGFQNVMEA